MLNMPNNILLGDMLVKLGLISQKQLEDILQTQRNARQQSGTAQTHSFLGELLVRKGLVSQNQLIPVLEYQMGLSYVDLRAHPIDQNAIRMISETTARKYNMIPIGIQDGKIQVAMADPQDILAQSDIKLITGLEPDIYLGFRDEIEAAINSNYTTSEIAEQAMEELAAEAGSAQDLADDNNDDEVSRAPIVRVINSIFETAVRMKASDIHIEPMDKQIKVRMRVDGDLKEMMTMPKSTLQALVARIKIMSDLDIAEKRVPQDGGLQLKLMNRVIDFRVSILPLVYGEKIVMRILDRASIMVTKEQLGFTPHNIKLFDQLIKAPEGIMLLSGPTGSGKTTTLYTALNEIVTPTINVITVEDPVEYRLDNVHQMQVNTKAGLTFAAGLRSILRQDPDVIMVGEIRDAETAEIAVRAAITGHMVLSTIHTNDTVSTILRLADMGIETYMVAAALNGVVAQRLVKRICTNCKRPKEATPEEKALLGLPAEQPFTIQESAGCNLCGGSGYAGRIAVHEVLVMDRELRAMAIRGDSTDAIKAVAIQKGLRTLADSCRELVLEGVTSIDEMMRVTFSVDG